MQTEHTDKLNQIWDSLQEEDKERTIKLRLVFWISLTNTEIWPRVMKRAESYDLAKSKKTESLAEYLFTHNVRHGVVILKKVAHVARKKIPVFDHT